MTNSHLEDQKTCTVGPSKNRKTQVCKKKNLKAEWGGPIQGLIPLPITCDAAKISHKKSPPKKVQIYQKKNCKWVGWVGWKLAMGKLRGEMGTQWEGALEGEREKRSNRSAGDGAKQEGRNGVNMDCLPLLQILMGPPLVILLFQLCCSYSNSSPGSLPNFFSMNAQEWNHGSSFSEAF